MAKITRPQGNVKAFASEAVNDERTVFADNIASDDLTQNINADYLRGWRASTPNLATDVPPIQDFNAFGFASTQLSSYLFQMGVTEYDSVQEYHLNSFVQYSGRLYKSLIDNNFGNRPDVSPAAWSDYVSADTTGKIATQAEAIAGTSNDKIMTPLRNEQHFTNKLATQAEAIAGTSNDKIMTPLRNEQHFTNKLATQAEGLEFTSNNKILTPYTTPAGGNALTVESVDLSYFENVYNLMANSTSREFYVQTPITTGDKRFPFGTAAYVTARRHRAFRFFIEAYNADGSEHYTNRYSGEVWSGWKTWAKGHAMVGESSGVVYTLNAEHTAIDDGWIYLKGTGTLQLTVAKTLYNKIITDAYTSALYFPVAKGQNFKGIIEGTGYLYFFPLARSVF